MIRSEMRLGRSVKRSLGYALLVVAVTATLSTGAMLARALMMPVSVSDRRPVFDFEQKASLDYAVNLHPSPLYDQEVLGPGSAYLLNLVRDIELKATYTLTTTPPVAINCGCSMVGTLRVYDTAAKDAIVIWSKQYPLLPETEVASERGEVRLDRELTIDPGQYSPVIDTIYDLSEVKPARALLTVEWIAQARTGEGIPLCEPATTSVVIPVAAKYFTISGHPTAEQKGSFTVSDEAPNTRILVLRRNWGIASGISVVVLLVAVLITRAQGGERQARALRAAVHRFGGRLVRSRSKEAPGLNVVELATADDLLRAADEVGKPVIYVPGDGVSRPHVFYVLDGDTRYQFLLRSS